jgi:hypothetical protein
MLELLEHERATALAHDEAVAVDENGRLAPAGSSLRVDIAFMELKPAYVMGVMVASAPPASMRSASP